MPAYLARRGTPERPQDLEQHDCIRFLNRKPHPVAHAYRMLLEEFGQITIAPHSEFLDITDRPARLKFAV